MMLEWFADFSHNFSFGNFVTRSTLLLILAVMVSHVCRNSSAAVRHRVWLLGLSASLMVPITAGVLPRIAIPMLPSASYELGVFETESTARIIDIASLEQSPASEQRRPIPQPIGQSVPGVVPAKNAAQSSKALAPLVFHNAPKQALLLCWFAGVVFGAIGFLLAALWQTTRHRLLPIVSDTHWQASVADAAKQVGLARCPKTIVADQQCVPSTTGIFRPILVVPSHWGKWSPDQRECILLHELAHIRRCDVAAQCVARLAILVHWFNPLVWFAARQMRIERELAADDCVLHAGQTPSNYAQQLLAIVQDYRSTMFTTGVAMATSARLDDRVRAILDPRRKRQPVGRPVSLMATCGVALVCIVVGTVTPIARAIAQADEPPKVMEKPDGPKEPVWKETYMVRFEETLPVSVALSINGKTMLTGSANGELMDLNLNNNQPTYNWKANVGGSHPAIAYSLDGKLVYATTSNGVRILDAERGTMKELIEEPNSQPIAVRAFPIRPIDDRNSYTKIAFGNARGYFVKTWPTGQPDKAGMIETTTVPEGQQPLDGFSVPLAVDPLGRSAIMTGPIDGTGKVSGRAGANVLWAYVCGNYEEGTPGNRVMIGHQDSVVSAAWSQNGNTAITGDAAGCLIEWNARTMKEKHRRELGGRIAALAISKDGSTAVAYVLGKSGQVIVWDATDSTSLAKVIHVEPEDLSGPTAFASLDIASDGNRIVGSAGDREWLDQSVKPNLVGRVRVWELATAPRDQPTPKLLYSEATMPRSRFVITNNHSLVRTVATGDDPGHIDFVRVFGGEVQMRTQISELPLRQLKISQDREWVAVEQQTKPNDKDVGQSFDVVVRNAMIHRIRATISNCEQLLDLSSNGDVVAVVRDGAIELWDTKTIKRIKRASFEHARIDATEFSPDSSLLAVSDRHTLVLWRWQEDQFERIDVGREVASLAFSPDGRRLAEGPAADKTIQIRDVETKTIVLELSRDSLSVPQLMFAQGGRVLIACDRYQYKDPTQEKKPRPRIFLWDTLDGSLAHAIVTAGPVQGLDLSPNERFLVAQVDEPNVTMLNGWRLDGNTIGVGGNESPAASK